MRSFRFRQGFVGTSACDDEECVRACVEEKPTQLLVPVSHETRCLPHEPYFGCDAR